MTSVCAIVYLYATGHSTLEGDTRTYEQFLYYKSVLPEFWGSFYAFLHKVSLNLIIKTCDERIR